VALLPIRLTVAWNMNSKELLVFSWSKSVDLLGLLLWWFA